METEQPVDPILQTSMTQVNPARSLLPPGRYRAKVDSIMQARNKDNTGNVIKLRLSTVDDNKGVDGTLISPGFPLFGNISITPTPNYPEENIKKSLKRFQVACQVNSEQFHPLSQYAGVVLQVDLKVKPASGDYEEGNEIKGYYPIKNS